MSASPSVQLASSCHIKVAGRAQVLPALSLETVFCCCWRTHTSPAHYGPGASECLRSTLIAKKESTKEHAFELQSRNRINKDILIHRPNRRIWGWTAILPWKGFANLFRRPEYYLNLVQYCFCKENTGVASRRGHPGLRLSGPRPWDLVWSW